MKIACIGSGDVFNSFKDYASSRGNSILSINSSPEADFTISRNLGSLDSITLPNSVKYCIIFWCFRSVPNLESLTNYLQSVEILEAFIRRHSGIHFVFILYSFVDT